MSEFPKTGMKCEQVRSRLKKNITAIEPNVKASLINQAKLHEGDGVVTELAKEFCGDNSRKHKVKNAKTRGNYGVGICLKSFDCANDGIMCNECVRFDRHIKKGSE